jgi:hypothetical protein
VGYETIRRIGRGGMGVVDLGRAPDGTEVALKRLSLHGTPEELELARQRIRREAEVLQQLDHPALVRLLDVVDDGDDLILVMAYLPGGNLAQRVAERGPLRPYEVRQLADHLLDGLAAAHRQGIVHRDIKPSNVLFDADGNAALADFGAAIHRDATVGLTASEVVVGTPGFMAPEQARGEPATSASDVFSLGATIMFAATGDGPFGSADPRVLMMRAAAGRTEKVPKTLPPDLRRRLEFMLDRDPARRPTAAAARGGPAGTNPRTAMRTVRRPAQRRGTLLAIAVAVMGAGAVLALLTGTGKGDRLPAAQGPTTSAPRATSTTATCTPQRYLPCGGKPAPHTDGRRCLRGFADYDERETDGCEAAPDVYDGTTSLDDRLVANLVPADDIDSYRLPVQDHAQLLCNGRIHVTLVAPPGVSQKLTVLMGGEVKDAAVSGGGAPASVSVGDPHCGGDDSGVLRIRVESVGSDRTAKHYVLTRSGSF